MVYYKLTDEDGQTYNGTVWGEGVTHTARGSGHQFCSEDLIHFYSHPLLAALLNPRHCSFKRPILWECEAQGAVYSDDGLKLGAKTVTTVRRIPLPEITPAQRVKFAILCVQVCPNLPARWVRWAKGWLSGKDRTYDAATAADYVAGAGGADYAACAADYAACAACAAARTTKVDLIALALVAWGHRLCK